MDSINDLFDRITARLGRLDSRVGLLEAAEYTHWKGTSSSDFTTTTLPNPGDYGYQTSDNELQVNVGGTIRAIATSAL